jgi:hypothetical protein
MWIREEADIAVAYRGKVDVTGAAAVVTVDSGNAPTAWSEADGSQADRLR